MTKLRATSDVNKSDNKLKLLEAELRIDALEAAAVKTALLAAQAITERHVVAMLTGKLIACVDQFVDELDTEGLKHSKHVETSLLRLTNAANEIRGILKKRLK